MPESSYYQSPRWSNEIADCSMPMTFDTYSNCSYGCLYCFSQYQRGIGGAKTNYEKGGARPVNVEKVKRIFTEPDNYQFGEYVKARKYIQWGGLSDQFDEYERKNGATLELLKFFKEIDYPICFSTKSTWWTQDERYMSLFRGQKNWNVKFSIITLDLEKTKIMEAGVDTPFERLKAIERIAKSNCGGATLRLRPFIIGISTPSYLELITKASDCGINAVSTEFFCLEQRSPTLKAKMPIFDELCGFDVTAFYRRYSAGSGYLRLNRKVKQPFIAKMYGLCNELNLRFYVSDAHFKELCANGSCCGLSADCNYSRGQWCEALQIAKREGSVHYTDVSGDIEKLFTLFNWGNAEGYNANSSAKRAHFLDMSMADYMHWLWNNPHNGQSPYLLFEGVLIPDGKDSAGDIIYKYNGKRSLSSQYSMAGGA